jgi:hypothetical protein
LSLDLVMSRNRVLQNIHLSKLKHWYSTPALRAKLPGVHSS